MLLASFLFNEPSAFLFRKLECPAEATAFFRANGYKARAAQNDLSFALSGTEDGIDAAVRLTKRAEEIGTVYGNDDVRAETRLERFGNPEKTTDHHP